MVKTEKATFAMGCFWKPQLLFDKVKGALKTEVGYMGGDENAYSNPSYKQVCTYKTGYAEVVQIEFNPDKISYKDILDIFWKNHNPTTLNRQGLDFGTQYRSAIFYYNEKQKKEALKSKEEMQKKLNSKKTLFGTKKIVTEIIKAGTFFKAEEYHQNYLEKNGGVC